MYSKEFVLSAVIVLLRASCVGAVTADMWTGEFLDTTQDSN